MSIRKEQLGFQWVDFNGSIFRKGVLHEDLSTFTIKYIAEFLEWEMFQTKGLEEIKTLILN